MQSRMLDKPQFESYVSRYRPVLMAFFMRRVANRVEAEDLTHDALIRLANAAPRTVDNPNAYVFQVAANLLCDRRRKARVRHGYLAALRETERERVDSLDPMRVALSRESLEVLRAALQELPTRTRNILLSYRLERVGKREIAASYGISTSAVDKHLMRAMAHIIRRTKVER